MDVFNNVVIGAGKLPFQDKPVVMSWKILCNMCAVCQYTLPVKEKFWTDIKYIFSLP